jgi:UDP-N-acetylmuramate dehydrogenase
MQIAENVALSGYSTMRLGGKARYLKEVFNKDDLTELVEWAENKKIPIIMIGGGSNIVWKDEGFSGLVIVNKIKGFETTDPTLPEMLVTVGAGEDWDFVVERVTNLGFSGIESLSLIPGSAGATPIQNVGAYGGEISRSLVSVEAYDRADRRFLDIPSSECNFSYRSSRFKTTDKNRFFITAITLRLTKTSPEAPFYASVQEYLDENHIVEPTPSIIRQAVIHIRQSKLPDPKIVPNTGSFFTNPVVGTDILKKIQKEYQSVPYWQVNDSKVKLSAAWLIEQSGFKAINDPETGMSTWPTQPLVLVNSGARHTSDLLKFKSKIVNEVRSKFGIELVQEPELLP